MAQPFSSNWAYIQAVLELADRRLAPLEQPEASRAEQPPWRERYLERQLRDRCQATVEAGGSAPLEYLLRTFALTEFERHCVYLALAPELDAAYEERFAQLQAGGGRLPCLELCLRSFGAGPRERSELLGRWVERRETLLCFFSQGGGDDARTGGLTQGLKLERRVVDFLLSPGSGDPLLEGCVERVWPGEEEAPLPLHGDLLERMEAWADPAEEEHRLFFLQGEEGAGRKTLAGRFCQARRLPLLICDLAALLRLEEGWQTALRAVCRETLIHRAALAFTGCELLVEQAEGPAVREDEEPEERAAETGAREEKLRQLLSRAALVTRTLFLLSHAPWTPELPDGPWRRVELRLETPEIEGRVRLWRHCLRGAALDEGVNLPVLAAKFALGPGQVAAAVRRCAELARWEGSPVFTEEMLHLACRGQLAHRLGKLATLVRAAYAWEDLILPPEQKRMLEDACAQVEYRHRVYDQWGFGKKVAYGRGLSMLFTGPPGTGKTMAAQVIANRLRLELYKVDLSGVLSKYIGETEKQLGAVFEEVKRSQSILFFDEADALFGKRSETRDAQDRYANVQTSYLLQKMEEYDGIVILASNFLQNFDEAFRRRIKFVIEFPLPDRDRRERIWRGVLPENLPRGEDLDFDFLSRSMELSGSAIKNIAVSAAFLAAQEDVPVGMVHLLLAAQAEQVKSGKSMGPEDFGEYYYQMRDYRSAWQEKE